MSLQGVLADFGVAEVFQLIAQQRKSGVLEVERQGVKLEIHFQNGMVLRARPAENRPDTALAESLLSTGLVSEPALAEAQRTQEGTLESLAQLLVRSEVLREDELERAIRLLSHETIFELFRWDDGSFRFRPQGMDEQIGDDLVGAEQVLLDAMRMRDEWSHVQGHLADLSIVLAQSADIEVFQMRRAEIAAQAGLDPDDLERLFNLTDGRLPARRVVDLSRLGTFLGAKGLVALKTSGLLRVEARPQPEVSTESPARSAFRPTLGICALALGALVALALLIIPAPIPSDYPIPGDSLREARGAAESERVRLYLEARRWAQGGYPSRLEAETALLAPVSPDRYIYAREIRGYALERLAP